MKKIILAALLAAVIVPAASAAPITDREQVGVLTKPANRACQAVFDGNRALIESMARSGNTTGIQRLFNANGCPGAAVVISKLPASPEKQQTRMVCTFKLIPPTITCTFGMAGAPVSPSAY